MARRIVDTASFDRSADPQLSSPFFALLPAEIRNLIYLEFWNLCSTRQHVVKNQIPDEENAEGFNEWSHVPCLIDPRAEDTRFDEYATSAPASPERNLWGKRLKSEWCLHWACEEQIHHASKTAIGMGREMLRALGEANEDVAAASGSQFAEKQAAHEGTGSQSTKTGLLSLATTCKRMYLESLPSLYSSTTFVLTDTRTAEEFLSWYGDDAERHPIRSLEICIRVPNILTEIYYPPARSNGDEGPPAVFAGRARPMLSMKNNPWQHLCDVLVVLPNLHDLRVWLDSSDLRPWHKRVSETRFFARLCDVRGPDKTRFVLGLPELPERRGPDSHALEGQYLEGEKLDDVPFMVERGPRPNNWRVHLRSIVNAGAAALSAEI